MGYSPRGRDESDRTEHTGAQGFFPDGPAVKNLPANAGVAKDALSIPGWGRSPGVRKTHSTILA